MRKLEGFQCEYCDEIFQDLPLCEVHEAQHITEESLEITYLSWTHHDETPDNNYNNRVGIFPSEVFIENKDFSGYASKYRLVRVGAVEDIYPIDDD